MPKNSDSHSTALERLRVPRSSLCIELNTIERSMLALASMTLRARRTPAEKAKYQRLSDRRAVILRLLLERDSYILQCFTDSLPASARRDLYANVAVENPMHRAGDS